MKVKYIVIVLLFASFAAIAEYDYTKPNYILLDKDKNPVEGVTKSVDDSRCQHKASKQKTGVYYCRQPDITITVNNPVTDQASSDEVTVSWTAPTEFTDGTKINKIDEFKVYINDDPVSVSGEKSTHSVNLPDGNHSFYVTAVVNNVESGASNLVIKNIPRE